MTRTDTPHRPSRHRAGRADVGVPEHRQILDTEENRDADVVLLRARTMEWRRRAVGILVIVVLLGAAGVRTGTEWRWVALSCAACVGAWIWATE